MLDEELRESLDRAFQAYRGPLETVMYFKYLLRVFTAGGDNWPALVCNLSKARKNWVRITRILIR